MKTIVLAGVTFILACTAVWGQTKTADTSPLTTAAMEQRIRELEDRVIALEGKLRTMESNAGAQPPLPQPAQPQPTSTAAAGAQTAQTSVPVTSSPNETQAGIAAGGQLPVYGGGSAAASKALN